MLLASFRAVRAPTMLRCWRRGANGPLWRRLRKGCESTRRRARSTGRKLRVGYVSAFFRSSNWMKPVWGVINHHDRARFDIHLLSDGDPPNEEERRRHPRDRLHDVRSMSNRELAAAVIRLRINILVDLNGYSSRNGSELHDDDRRE